MLKPKTPTKLTLFYLRNVNGNVTSAGKPTCRKRGIANGCRESDSTWRMSDKTVYTRKLSDDLIASVRARESVDLIYYNKTKLAEKSDNVI